MEELEVLVDQEVEVVDLQVDLEVLVEVANPFLEDQAVVVEMMEEFVMLKEVEVSYLVELKFLFTVLASGEEVASNS
jgi:hypothetical protein